MYFAGIDAGCVTTKAVIIDDDYSIIGKAIINSEPDVEKIASEVINKSLMAANLKIDDITQIVSTGSGRNAITFIKQGRTEIICQTTAINRFYADVRTILDVGGQDSRAIRINSEGRVRQFIMNDRCAAGAGRFVEVMAEALRVPIEKWGNVVKSSNVRSKISSYCTIFAESEAISMLSQQVPVNEILAGLCEATVSRLYQMILKLGDVEKEICFTGGVALNEGIVKILEEKLNCKIIVPEHPQYTGAMGAAFLANSTYSNLSR